MILLTGTSGFIGRHLLIALIKTYGASEILAFTSRPIDDCPFVLHTNYHIEKDLFVRSGYEPIETVIHAGAFTPKTSSQSNDWRLCTSNISSTDSLLSATMPNLKRIIYLSTLDVYDRCEVISEQSAVSPASLYGYSKLYCEKMVESWSYSNKTVVQLLRVGHVYGPGEEAYQKIIPTTIRKIQLNQPVEIWGEGNEYRSFIYIGDVVQAIVNSVKLNQNEGVINLVSQQKIRVWELINKLIQISGQKVVVKRVESDSVGRDYIFNNDKMKKVLWPSEITLEQGLMEEWNYMQHLSHANIL